MWHPALRISTDFKNVVKTTIVAALHVLILVASLTTLRGIDYVCSVSGDALCGNQTAFVCAGRIRRWKRGICPCLSFVWTCQNPCGSMEYWFATYADGGYQVAQSLFAIGTFTVRNGTHQGTPDKIPVAEILIFIFSAISEELGLIFALCLILICVSCYVMFLNIAMQLRNVFYKLVALGLGTRQNFQVISAPLAA